jgi:hypothetical protein
MSAGGQGQPMPASGVRRPGMGFGMPGEMQPQQPQEFTRPFYPPQPPQPNVGAQWDPLQMPGTLPPGGQTLPMPMPGGQTMPMPYGRSLLPRPPRRPGGY